MKETVHALKVNISARRTTDQTAPAASFPDTGESYQGIQTWSIAELALPSFTITPHLQAPPCSKLSFEKWVTATPRLSPGYLRCPQVPHALEQSQELSVPRAVSLPPLLAANGACPQEGEPHRRFPPWQAQSCFPQLTAKSRRTCHCEHRINRQLGYSEPCPAPRGHP